MPLLSDFELREDPLNLVARQVQAKLRTVDDARKVVINDSVEFGIDSALWDVITGGIDSGPDQFPMIRIYYGVIERETDDGLTGIAYSIVPMYLYFLYYIGIPSSDPNKSSFVEARENHIRMNLDALRMDRLIPFTDATGGDVWRWVVQTIQEDHDTPFKYFDTTVRLGRDFACSRVDITFRCKGSIA